MTRAEAAASALLVLALGWTAWDVSRIGREAAPAPHPITTARPRPMRAAVPDDAYAGIVSRSLFVPERRADFASASRNPNAVGGHVLRGVMQGDSDAVALFEPLAGGAARRLRTGSMIGGYRIVLIDGAGVELERDGRGRHVEIDDGPMPMAIADSRSAYGPNAYDPPAYGPPPYAEPASPADLPPPVRDEPTPDEIDQ